MTLIQDNLVIGVRVDGGHHTVLDAPFVVDDFGRGSQTVGGAGSIGENVMALGIVLVFVHTQDDGEVFILGRSGNNNFFRAGIFDVSICAGFSLFRIAEAVSENTGGFNYDINLKRCAFVLTSYRSLTATTSNSSE
jgi:hypothetical protein